MGHKNKTPDHTEKSKLPTEPVEEKPEAKSTELVEGKPEVKPMTPEEQALALRVMRDQDSWENIKEEEMVDFSLSADVYALPPEAQALQTNKKFAFRFIEMTPRRIDEVTNWPPPKKWWIVNRALLPELSKYCDPVHGAIQKEDQMLVMKPWHLHERYENSKRRESEDKLSSGELKSKHGLKEELEEGVTRTEMVAGEKARVGSGDVVMESA